jgi:AcrR family transcriptional regulator
MTIYLKTWNDEHFTPERIMSRKNLADVRREEILHGFARCIIKYGLDVSLEQIAAETGVKRSIIRHYIGNREDLIEALIERITQVYLEQMTTRFEQISETHSETALLDYLFDVEASYADWDRVIIDVLVTAKERYPSAKQSLQNMFRESVRLLTNTLAIFYPAATSEQHSHIAYTLFCLVTTHETMQWVGFDSIHEKAVQGSALVLLDKLRSA